MDDLWSGRRHCRRCLVHGSRERRRRREQQGHLRLRAGRHARGHGRRRRRRLRHPRRQRRRERLSARARSTGTPARSIVGGGRSRYAGLEPITVGGHAHRRRDHADREQRRRRGAPARPGDATKLKLSSATARSRPLSFTDPTGSLTINGGAGNDTITFSGAVALGAAPADDRRRARSPSDRGVDHDRPAPSRSPPTRRTPTRRRRPRWPPPSRSTAALTGGADSGHRARRADARPRRARPQRHRRRDERQHRPSPRPRATSPPADVGKKLVIVGHGTLPPVFTDDLHDRSTSATRAHVTLDAVDAGHGNGPDLAASIRSRMRPTRSARRRRRRSARPRSSTSRRCWSPRGTRSPRATRPTRRRRRSTTASTSRAARRSTSASANATHAEIAAGARVTVGSGAISGTDPDSLAVRRSTTRRST